MYTGNSYSNNYIQRLNKPELLSGGYDAWPRDNKCKVKHR